MGREGGGMRDGGRQADREDEGRRMDIEEGGEMEG